MCWSTISTNLLFYPKWCNFLTLVTFVVKKIVKRMHFGTVNPWVITWIYICEMAMNQLEKQDFWDQNRCPGWGSNSRPSDYETDALPTALPRQMNIWHNFTKIYFQVLFCHHPTLEEKRHKYQRVFSQTRHLQIWFHIHQSSIQLVQNGIWTFSKQEKDEIIAKRAAKSHEKIAPSQSD